MEIVGPLAAGFMGCTRFCQQLDEGKGMKTLRVSYLILVIHRLLMKLGRC